jgi:class 3 adenylate cyclase/tetratricopeptide (TPR) repeat protein
MGRLLPEELSAKAFAQKDRHDGERRQVTVMVCDLEGYSGLAERLGAERAYALMDRVYEILIRRVYHFEGTVNELTGDGILAFFGAPVALEDAPQRAIRSALSIHQEIARFGESSRQDDAEVPALRMRIGIHTGPVVVGSLGTDLRIEFKAVGDTVNLASRLESMAAPGTVFVSEETFRLTEGLFRFEALGERAVKGREHPVRVYRVIAPGTSRTRFDVAAERGLTPFVGRDRELELLLDALERAREGRGQAFSIVAEAGIGKSRLLYEFRKAVAGEDVTFLEGRCLSYGRASAYHPLIDVLKSRFDIHDDGQAEARARILHELEALGVDPTDTLPYLLQLLSIRDPDAGSLPSSPEIMKHRTVEALNRLVVRGSEARPLILAFEDLHWIDRSSEEYLKLLMNGIPGARVFLILTYRPEFAMTWGARSYHGQVNLNRLSNRESLTLVKHILKADEVDPRLEVLILEKTEGIPLFVEEFTKSLDDLGLIDREGGPCRLAKDTGDPGIPSTIQDVIMARVDSLPEDAKNLLRAGSVIEREFDYRLIEMVSGLGERDLISGLSALKDSELLYERGIYPHARYIFKHPLTREVVYGSILGGNQKLLHERVGAAMEKIHGDNPVEYYGVLARHFIEGGNYEKGAKYSELAAKKAHQAGSILDAIEHAKRWVSCHEREGGSASAARSMEARMTLAGYYLVRSELVGAREAVAPVVETVPERDYQVLLPGILTVTGLHHLWVEGDVDRGSENLQRVLDFPESPSTTVWHWFASYYLGAHAMWNCEFDRAQQFYERSLAISRTANHTPGIATANSMVALCQAFSGSIDRAYPASARALELARQTDHPTANLAAFSHRGVVCFLRGEFDEAEENLREGMTWYEKTIQAFYSFVICFYLGDLCCALGDHGDAVEYYERSLTDLHETLRIPALIGILTISSARARALAGERDISHGELFRQYQNVSYRLWQGSMARQVAEILLALGDRPLSEAEEWLDRAIEMDRGNGLRWQLGQDHTSYAELCVRRGNLDHARDHLSRAVEIFRDCGATGYREKADRALAAIPRTTRKP